MRITLFHEKGKSKTEITKSNGRQERLHEIEFSYENDIVPAGGSCNLHHSLFHCKPFL